MPLCLYIYFFLFCSLCLRLVELVLLRGIGCDEAPKYDRRRGRYKITFESGLCTCVLRLEVEPIWLSMEREVV
jgi:hypothetical protein